MKKAKLYYDGFCPFCNSYSKLKELRECVNLELCDARVDLSWKDIDKKLVLDDGIILILDTGKVFQGVDALNYLKNICKFKTVLLKLQNYIFSRKNLGAFLYALLKLLRKITIKLKIILKKG